MFMLMTLESRVAADHPLRRTKALADAALEEPSPLFDEMYGETGRPSVPPERLLEATPSMALYSVRSERQFCEQLDHNLLFRWFLDMNMEEPGFVPTVFTRPTSRRPTRGQARAEEQRQGGQARSRGARPDGEPERTHRGSVRHGGHGFAERRAALAMIDSSLVGSRRVTLAADRGYDAREFVSELIAERNAARGAHEPQARRGRDADREARRVTAAA